MSCDVVGRRSVAASDLRVSWLDAEVGVKVLDARGGAEGAECAEYFDVLDGEVSTNGSSSILRRELAAELLPDRRSDDAASALSFVMADCNESMSVLLSMNILYSFGLAA